MFGSGNAGSTEAAHSCRSLLGELLDPILDDVGPAAHQLIAEFGSLGGVMAAEPARLQRVLGDTSPAIAYLGTVRRAWVHSLRREALDEPVLSSSSALHDYLHATLAPRSREQFRGLFLTSDNRLLGDTLIADGTIDETSIYPREIARRAIELGARRLILVHNHPSGDPTPSPADIHVTRRIASVLRGLDVALIDHLVVARSGSTSFRELGLL